MQHFGKNWGQNCNIEHLNYNLIGRKFSVPVGKFQPPAPPICLTHDAYCTACRNFHLRVSERTAKDGAHLNLHDFDFD